MNEMASVTPMLAGVNYERLEGFKSLQWPVAADGSDQRAGANGHLVRGELYSWPGAIPLNNGRLLEHFHEGNMTYRVKGIQEKTPDTFVEISPELAQERGVQSGTWLLLISRYGQVRVRALVTDRVSGREPG